MLSMVVTADVFQESSGWLKASAPWNMPSMVVTAAVFPGTEWMVEGRACHEHALHGGHCRGVPRKPSGWLKAMALANILSMLVTAEVSQESIG